MRITKDKEERRQDLIDVAERLFLSRGYETTSVSDIVREAGVAQGTFYYHFKSKDDVLVSVVNKAVGELEQRLLLVLDGAKRDPWARMRGVVRLLVETAGTAKALIDYVHADSNALLHHRLDGTTSRMLRKHFAGLVQQGVETGHFRVSHVSETADFLLGGLMGFFHTQDSFASDEGRKRIFEAIDLLLARSLGISQE